MQLGQDVAAEYGAVKFYPPVRTTAGDAEADHPRFFAYTDIENMRSYPTVLREGEEVVATEKIHGTNCRIGFVREVEQGQEQLVRLAGSRTLRRRAPPPEQWRHNTYWSPHESDGVTRLFAALYAAGVEGCTLYGEVFGKGIQSYTYGAHGPQFRAFDLAINGRYVDYDRYKAYCEQYGIPMAPLCYRGPFSLAAIKALSDGPSLVGGAHGREGVVVRPTVERDDPVVGRVILKYVGDGYLFGKAAEQDTTDV
jgi:RNA ligase (TIGR02306 family)